LITWILSKATIDKTKLKYKKKLAIDHLPIFGNFGENFKNETSMRVSSHK
jgi:hypothetical protein